MKGMVEYADKAVYSRLKYCFNDLIVLCIYNGTGVVCTALIEQLQCATVTGHLLNIKSLSCTCTETQTCCKYNRSDRGRRQPDMETLNNKA